MKQLIKASIFAAIALLVACSEKVENPQLLSQTPNIYPDYVGVAVPRSIAPLNFSIVASNLSNADVVIKSDNGEQIHTQGLDINLPEKRWHTLLSNAKDSVTIIVSAKCNGKWVQYRPFTIYISNNSIDYGIAYRLFVPGYAIHGKMGIYERDLSTFSEKPVIENSLFDETCVNCHSFNQNKPQSLSLHIRGQKHSGTLLRVNDSIKVYTSKTDSTIANCMYSYWHPSGKYLAYAQCKVTQQFHNTAGRRTEVYDKVSDVGIYDVKHNELFASPLLRTPNHETYPAFSPDGRTLYFCSAPLKNMPSEYEKIKYSLCAIAFDPSTGSFGNKVDTILSSAALGKSITFPRPSYDGRYILVSVSEYGVFPVCYNTSDLMLFDLKKKIVVDLSSVNSPRNESYHCWSSNSKWFLFSSKRDDGLHSRVYITGFDKHGNPTKPFMLPQKSPRIFYDNSFFSYNIPEFITEPVLLNNKQSEKNLMSDNRIQMKWGGCR